MYSLLVHTNIFLTILINSYQYTCTLDDIVIRTNFLSIMYEKEIRLLFHILSHPSNIISMFKNYTIIDN